MPTPLQLAAVLRFAHVSGQAGNHAIIFPGTGLAVAFHLRVGAAILPPMPVRLGGGDLKISQVFGTDESEELATQIKMAREHKRATHHNTDTLKNKHRQNRDAIITSLMLLG